MSGGMTTTVEGRWPDLIGVGAAKSGTTSLYRCLDAHPQVFMSPIKEPNFFSTDIDPDGFRADYLQHERQKRLDVERYVRGDMSEKHWGAYVRDPAHYRALFRNSRGDQSVGEISNSYLYSETAAENIAAQCPGARIFMILRNPVERAYSHYLANVRDGRAILPFRNEIESDLLVTERRWGGCHLYVDLGLYAEQVKRFTSCFGASRLKIYLYDDFAEDPYGVVRDLYAFAGVDPGFPPPLARKENQARTPRFPRLVYFTSTLGIKKPLFRMIPARYREQVKSRFFRPGSSSRMTERDRQYMLSFFYADIESLAALIGRDLSHWLETKQGAD